MSAFLVSSSFGFLSEEGTCNIWCTNPSHQISYFCCLDFYRSSLTHSKTSPCICYDWAGLLHLIIIRLLQRASKLSSWSSMPLRVCWQDHISPILALKILLHTYKVLYGQALYLKELKVPHSPSRTSFHVVLPEQKRRPSLQLPVWLWEADARSTSGECSFNALLFDEARGSGRLRLALNHPLVMLLL